MCYWRELYQCIHHYLHKIINAFGLEANALYVVLHILTMGNFGLRFGLGHFSAKSPDFSERGSLFHHHHPFKATFRGGSSQNVAERPRGVVFVGRIFKLRSTCKFQGLKNTLKNVVDILGTSPPPENGGDVSSIVSSSFLQDTRHATKRCSLSTLSS